MTKQLELEKMWDKLGTNECGACDEDYHQRIDAYVTRFHTSSDQTTIKIPVKFCPVCGRQLH